MSNLKNDKLYHFARSVKRFMRQRFNELADPDQRVVSLKPLANSKGNVLLSYFPDFFLALPVQAVKRREFARTIKRMIMNVQEVKRYRRSKATFA